MISVRRAAPLGLALAACAAPKPAPAPPPPVPPVDRWHAEPVLAEARSGPILVYNHADASLPSPWIAEAGERQYSFLKEFIGRAPAWIRLHVGAAYPCGFSTNVDGVPEMFLMAKSILDTRADYAHEMTHCFNSQFGRFPHWFEESLADVMYLESEIDLYHRAEEAAIVASFDRVDHRSYELVRLRARFGRGYYRKVYALLVERAEESRRLASDGDLEERNLFIIKVLSDAAGEELLPVFRSEFGFNPRTRERQRGY